MDDHHPIEVTLVVPCHNEEERLNVGRFRSFLKAHTHVAILFVNDGSTDATQTVLESVQSAAPHRVDILALSPNGGKAEAVRKGMLAANETRPSSLVGFWDADLATPLEAYEEFERVFQRRENTAAVWGTRLRLKGRTIDRAWIRNVLGRVFSFCAARAVPISVNDALCGAKMFHPSAVQPLFDRPFMSRWIFDVELLARLAKTPSGGADLVFEQPLDFWEEVGGSKVKLKDFAKAAYELSVLRLTAHREPNIEIDFSPVDSPAVISMTKKAA